MGHRTDGPPQNHPSFSFPEKPYARQLKRGALALRDFYETNVLFKLVIVLVKKIVHGHYKHNTCRNVSETIENRFPLIC